MPKCVDDIRRYSMMYFFCMIYQLIEVDVRQREIEDLLTQQELQLLLRTPRARAVTCIKWVAARLAHLEALGYMAPLQLHETNEGLQGMMSAFNGLVKIKSTPTPFPVRASPHTPPPLPPFRRGPCATLTRAAGASAIQIRQLCSVLAVVYVYFAPLALANEFSNILDQYWSVMYARAHERSTTIGRAPVGPPWPRALHGVPRRYSPHIRATLLLLRAWPGLTDASHAAGCARCRRACCSGSQSSA